MTHLPFRSWCSHCVRGKSRDDPHKRSDPDEKSQQTLATVSLDYFFMGKNGIQYTWDQARDGTAQGGDDEVMTLIAIYCHKTRCTFAHACPRKGNDPHVAKEVQADLEWLGYKRMIGKSDQEPAILALKRMFTAAMPTVEILPEESPVGAHGANGHIESAIGRVAGQVRTLKDSVEHKYGLKLDSRHPLMAWSVEYAAGLITRFQRGRDGRTAWELARGKSYKKRLPPFGETVHYKMVRSGQGHAGKLDVRWDLGIYVNMLKRSDEALVLTPAGVRKARALKRLPEGQRHNKELLSQAKGVPWDKYGRDPDAEEGTAVLPAGILAEPLHNVPIVAPEERPQPAAQMRRTYIRAGVELAKYGYTPGCSACAALLGGTRTTNHQHSEECRRRIAEAIANDVDPAVQEQADRKRQRQNESLAENLERADTAQSSVGASASTDTPMAAGGSVGDSASRPGKRSATPDEEGSKAAKAEKDTGGERKRSAGAASSNDPEGSKVARTKAATDTVSAKRGSDTATSELDNRPPKKVISALALRKYLQKEYKGCDVTPWECVELAASLQEMSAVDISEAYSPPRFTARAPFQGLKPGTAFDLKSGWDLGDDAQYKKARATVEEEQPYLLTGCPPCTAFSRMQTMNFSRQPAWKVAATMAEGRKHHQRAVQLYRDQLSRGGYILHEAPWSATSWKEPDMMELAARPDMYVVKGVMCSHGMTSTDKEGEGLVEKETGWMTNSPEMAKALQTVCSNKDGSRPPHRHVHLMEGRASAAECYPPKLVNAVLKALKAQMRADGEINSMEPGGPTPHEPMFGPQSQEVSDEMAQYWDDVRGGWLEPVRVKRARAEEIEQFFRYQVIEIVPRWRLTQSGKKALTTRWSDTNKGSAEAPDYRSRLCARELKARQKLGLDAEAGDPSDLFASMPPLEAVKLIFALLVSKKVSKHGKTLKVGLYDVSRAYFNADATREDLFIEVPDEMLPEGTDPKDVIGILLKSMYGTRDAGANWERELTSCYVDAGFKQGLACPNIYYHAERDIVIVNHGDDGHVLADDDGQAYVQKIMKDRYEVKVRAVLGTEPKDDKECTFLNRIVRINDEGDVEIEADPRHAAEIARTMGVSSGKTVTTPIVKEPAATAESPMPELDKDRTKTFRSVVMRACYMATERGDVQYCVKECAREMHCPTERGWMRCKRMARYLAGQPRMILTYKQQHMPKNLRVFTDSDHAGCKLTRKSTSGLCIQFGQHVVKTGSTTQSTLGLSSPESEYYALIKGASAGIGIQSVLADMGVQVAVDVYCDASSSISLAQRRGLGRARHVATRHLWIQDKVQKKEVQVHKIPRKLNPADLGTRCNTEAEIESAHQLMNIRPGMSMRCKPK